MSKIKSYIKTFALWELLRGLSVTLRQFFSNSVTLEYPEEKTPQSHRFCPALAITIESDVSDDGTRRTSRYDIDLFKCIYCGFCEEACPVDAIVETRIHEYHMEKPGENIMTKDKLLAVGDKYDAMISADKAADAKYR